MNETKALTKRQRDILDFIRNYIDLAHYAPTYREIEQVLGMKTKSHVHYHLCRLRDAGLITWSPGRVRTLRVLDVPAESSSEKRIYDD